MKKSRCFVVVAMGSKSDLPIMKEASQILEQWGVIVKTQIVSAHRTPRLLEKNVRVWEAQGAKIIIAGAGGAAHLPGMLAAFSVLPVIGVPIKTKSMNGLDSLLSIAQMPKGVPVATVAIDGAFNAALFALQILGISGFEFKKKIGSYKRNLAKQVSQHRKSLNRLGVTLFLKQNK